MTSPHTDPAGGAVKHTDTLEVRTDVCNPRKNFVRLQVRTCGFSPRLTVGYDFGNNWRVGVDYTRYKSSFEHTESDAALGLHNVGTLTGKIKKNVGVSVIYDFPVSEKVQPYLGARVGTNRVSYDYLELNRGNFNFEASGKETKTSVGALAGVGVKVSDKVTVDAGYRYNHWGKFFDNAKINSHEFSAGVRVKF